MTTNVELVEAAAATIYEAASESPFDKASPGARTVMREKSRAVLALIAERLREPSREMIRVAPTSYPIMIWEAMLAASPLYPPKEGNEE